jgi:hypothetical protein
MTYKPVSNHFGGITFSRATIYKNYKTPEEENSELENSEL